jgi:hypothetical protein
MTFPPDFPSVRTEPMRILLALAALAVGAVPATAQRPSQFMAKYGWHASLEEAKAAAAKTGKPIFLVFRCEP